MSTKASLAWADQFHLYEEVFDDNHIHLQLRGIAFEACRDSVTVAIPLAVWDVVRKKTLARFDCADRSLEEITEEVTHYVNGRNGDNQAAKENATTMAMALTLSDELIDLAKPHAAALHRTLEKQIEYWARLGKAVEDNPDLPFHFIKNTLLAIFEDKAGQLSEYKFGS